jgi:hypothetical protein
LSTHLAACLLVFGLDRRQVPSFGLQEGFLVHLEVSRHLERVGREETLRITLREVVSHLDLPEETFRFVIAEEIYRSEREEGMTYP